MTKKLNYIGDTIKKHKSFENYNDKYGNFGKLEVISTLTNQQSFVNKLDFLTFFLLFICQGLF